MFRYLLVNSFKIIISLTTSETEINQILFLVTLNSLTLLCSDNHKMQLHEVGSIPRYLADLHWLHILPEILPCPGFHLYRPLE